MSESETAEDIKMDNSPRKRVRHRKKKLYENILKQMEFYFSDANLSKDRFLADLVKNDPFVTLDLFLKFNKIRSLTTEVFTITRALKNSAILELSEDKLKVKRRTPILPYDADARTVYVESIPVTASREWLDKVFSEFGQVAYISLPKFKNSQKIKGFAFIEFSKPEEAQKCMSTFSKMGCKLPTSMPPEELSSIKMFSIDQPTEEIDVKKDDLEDYEPPKKKNKKQKDRKSFKSLDLKSTEFDNEKKMDTPTDDEKCMVTSLIEEDKNMDSESKDEMTSQDEEKCDTKIKKNKRKRSSKDKSKLKNGINTNEAPPGALWGLQVLPKSEWKALRNKYLNLQRKYMKEIKTNLINKRHYSVPATGVPTIDAESAISAAESGAKSLVTFERIPGVFVKENLSEPCLDVRLTKRMIRSNVRVQHVEVKEGQTEVIIRFDSTKAAEEYCASGRRAEVLTGADEDLQWARAETSRAALRRKATVGGLRPPDGLPRRPDGPRRTDASRRPDGPHRPDATPRPPDGRRTARAPGAPASPQPTHTHIRFDDE